MFLSDANVLSELRRRNQTNPKVAAWADAVHPADLFLSAITILEIEAGSLMIERRDAAPAAVLRAWIDGKALSAFDGRILPVDTAVALRCARLHVPDPRAERDASIAATSLVHRLKLTRNTADSQTMDVDLINPWN